MVRKVLCLRDFNSSMTDEMKVDAGKRIISPLMPRLFNPKLIPAVKSLQKLPFDSRNLSKRSLLRYYT